MRELFIENWILFALVLIAVIGLVLMLYVTDQGVSLGSDSAAYIAAAQNFLKGYGLSWVSAKLEVKPLVHYPPFYPIVLAGFELASINAIDAARLVNTIAFGLGIFLIGLIIKIATGSNLLAIGGALLMLVSGEQIEIHSWGMSEPLFISLSLLGLTLLFLFLRDSNAIYLVLSAFVFGLVAITRYIGAVYIFATLTVLMLDIRLEIRARLKNLLRFLIISTLPLAFWMMRNFLAVGKVSNRTLGLNTVTLERDFNVGFKSVLNWFLPLRIVEILQSRLIMAIGTTILVLIAILIIVAFLHFKAREDKDEMRIVPDPFTVLVIFALFFLLGLALSVLLTSPTPDISERILGPAYVLILMIVVLVIGAAIRTKKWIILLITIGLVVFLFRNKAVYTYWIVRDIHGGEGRFYTSRGWRNSPVIAELASYPDHLIYTDDIAAMYLLAGRYSSLIPIRIDLSTRLPNEDYLQTLASVRDTVSSGEAIIVLFSPYSIAHEYVPLDDLIEGFEILYESSNGMIVSASP